MEKLSIQNVEVAAEIAQLIETIVAKYGGSVRLPIEYVCGEGGTIDTLREMERVWSTRGVHVSVATRWNAFPRAVQEARRNAGLKPHPFYEDALIFEPETRAVLLGAVARG